MVVGLEGGEKRNMLVPSGPGGTSSHFLEGNTVASVHSSTDVHRNSGMSSVGVAGAVIGSVVALALLAIFATWTVRRHRQKAKLDADREYLQ